MLDTGHIIQLKRQMEILHIEKEDQLLNTLKHFHIYNLSKQKFQINDTYTDTHNPIFENISIIIIHNRKTLPLPWNIT
jgi:hypothetical protein